MASSACARTCSSTTTGNPSGPLMTGTGGRPPPQAGADKISPVILASASCACPPARCPEVVVDVSSVAGEIPKCGFQILTQFAGSGMLSDLDCRLLSRMRKCSDTDQTGLGLYYCLDCYAGRPAIGSLRMVLLHAHILAHEFLKFNPQLRKSN